MNGERSWVIPELEFFSDKGVRVHYSGGKTVGDIKVVCTNCGNTVARITVDVRMEIRGASSSQSRLYAVGLQNLASIRASRTKRPTL